jgi:hypothetical protein
MRKILLTLGIMVFLSGSLGGLCLADGSGSVDGLHDVAVVEDALKAIPALKQGLMYSVPEHLLRYISTAQVLEYKGFSLEIGYSQTASLIGVVSFQLLNLKKLGVNVPIIDLIECNIGYGVGISKISTAGAGEDNERNKLQHGPTVTLINLKF